jgi:hypothetical protein
VWKPGTGENVLIKIVVENTGYGSRKPSLLQMIRELLVVLVDQTSRYTTGACCADAYRISLMIALKKWVIG